MAHTLLLADDSVTVQRVIELTFADEDVRVIAVGDGEQAIAVLGETTPDIVLADVGMPGRDGYEVARYIRATPRLAHVPVLLLSGAFEPIDAVRAAEVGCQGVLTKPFEPQLVIARVRQVLEGTGASSFEAATPESAPAAGAAEATVVEQYFETLDEAFARLPGAAPAPRPAREVVLPPAVPSPSLPLSRAFAALLAAEQAQPSGTVVPDWSVPAGSGRLSEEAIEDIVRRVLARLPEDVVRQAVASAADITLDAAERLVREEIDRIKSNVR